MRTSTRIQNRRQASSTRLRFIGINVVARAMCLCSYFDGRLRRFRLPAPHPIPPRKIVTSRLRSAIVVAACLASLTAAGAQQPASSAGAPSVRIPFEKYTLPNGLTVVLAEDHATPTVSVLVMYHVGSKNETVGRTGFAHLFEHVMFTGSGHVPYGLHDRYTEGVGGGNNGTTNNDRTVYYENVPSNYLEHAIWLESDRMGWLLDALDTASTSRSGTS
jgi:zinc protease